MNKIQKTVFYSLEVKEDYLGSMRYWNIKDTNNQSYVAIYDQNLTSIGRDLKS